MLMCMFLRAPCPSPGRLRPVTPGVGDESVNRVRCNPNKDIIDVNAEAVNQRLATSAERMSDHSARVCRRVFKHCREIDKFEADGQYEFIGRYLRDANSACN